MAKLSGEQSCSSAINVQAKVGVAFESCTRSSNSSDTVTLKFKAYLYQTTDVYSLNSWAIYINGAEYLVFDSNRGTSHTKEGKKYYTPIITLNLDCPGSSTTFEVGVNGTARYPTSAHTNFTFTLSNVSARTYKITYNANSGTGAPSYSTKKHGTDLILSTTKPTKSGYTFKGWGTSASDTSVNYIAGGTYTANAEDTLYAIWAKTVNLIYNANGGTNAPAVDSRTIYNTETSYTFTVSNNVPSRAGYTFKGWAKSASATSASYSSGSSLTLSSSTTIYAVWQSINHQLTVNPNGGYRVSDNNTNNVVYTCNYGKTITLSKLARNSYDLVGYKLTATSDGSVIIGGSKVTFNADAQTADFTQGTFDVTATAQWTKKTYTVTYNANGGAGAPPNQNKTHGTNLTLSSSIPTKTNSIFLGWGAAIGTETILYYPGDTYSTNASITLYAVWESPKYIINYNANGGIGVPNSQTKYLNADLILSNAVIPKRDGYIFAGWNSAANGTGIAYTVGGRYSTNADATLYAQWATSITKCSAPTELVISPNTNNTIEFSCKLGNNGTNNKVLAAEIFVSFGTTVPSATSYQYKEIVNGTAGSVVTKTLSLADMPKTVMQAFLGDDCVGSIKFTARTVGAAGSNYASATATLAEAEFTWHAKAIAPKIIKPKLIGDVCGNLVDYVVEWQAGAGNTNNAFSKYAYRVYDETAKTNIITGNTTNLFYNIPADNLTEGHSYLFYIKTIGVATGCDSKEVKSGTITVKNIAKFNDIIPTAVNNTTVPMTNIYGTETFLNNGFGDVMKIIWQKPEGVNNHIKYYTVKIVDTDSGNIIIDNKIIRNNELLITSNMLNSYPIGINKLTVLVTAVSEYGEAYNSNCIPVYINYKNKCTGTYINVADENANTVMKRAVAFVKVFKNDSTNEFKWVLAEQSFAKDTIGTWKTSDTQYEVLIDDNNEIIVDENDTPILIL